MLPLDSGHVDGRPRRNTPKALKISGDGGGRRAGPPAALCGSFGVAILFGALAFFNGQKLRAA
ncbi:MAG: hypothetical protein R3A48_19615 [Polyangiales bacterium]